MTSDYPDPTDSDDYNQALEDLADEREPRPGEEGYEDDDPGDA